MSQDAERATEGVDDAMHGGLVFKGRLFRRRVGHGYRFTDMPSPPPLEPVRRPARVAQMLAFAHSIAAAIERGAFGDRAAAARHYQLTRARMTQLLNLTLLAPDIQEQVLFLEAVDGREPISARALRAIVRHAHWATQRLRWQELMTRFEEA